MSEHTPGPWIAPLDEPYDSTCRTYVLEDSEGHQLMFVVRLPEVGPQQHHANLRLIGAAPELLAILKTALEQTEDGGHFTPCPVAECWVERAEAAVAKVEGRSS